MDRAYTRDEAGTPVFRNSLVLFLDILGSSAMAVSESAERYLAILDGAMSRAREMGKDDGFGQPWFYSSWFSDNLALSAPIASDHGEDELILLASTIARIQLVLALEGIITRGGLTVGNHFQDADFAFGPALVEAVGLEREATFPRVLLHPNVAELARTHLAYYSPRPQVAPHNVYILIDQNGGAFINYLIALNDYVGESLSEAEDTIGGLRDRIAEAVQTNRGDPKKWEKWSWLAHYHNWFCEDQGLDPGLLVPTADIGIRFAGFAE